LGIRSVSVLLQLGGDGEEFLARSLSCITLKHPTLIASVEWFFWHYLIRSRTQGGGDGKTVHALDAAVPVGVAWVTWRIIHGTPLK
jgi:hypothetical protein